jgi:uncharacterized membrane protein YbhN (UPF0104 family)
MNMHTLRWLRVFLNVKVFIPVLLAVALLAFAFGLTDITRVLASIRQMPLSAIVLVFALAFIYFVLKALQLKLLLARLGIHSSWRRLLPAYSIGEMSVTIPTGVYAQNYVLQRVDRVSFARSAAATTAALAVEILVVLVGLVVVKIPGWPWLQLTTFALLVLAAAVSIPLATSRQFRVLALRWLQRGPLRPIGKSVLEFLQGLRQSASVAVMLPASLLGVAYLLVLALAFLTVGHAVGVDRLDFAQALSIYFFSLATILLLAGALTQLGGIELAGLGAAAAWGYSWTEGLAMLLGFRLVWTCSIWLIAGTLILLLRAELRAFPGDQRQEVGD